MPRHRQSGKAPSLLRSQSVSLRHPYPLSSHSDAFLAYFLSLPPPLCLSLFFFIRRKIHTLCAFLVRHTGCVIPQKLAQPSTRSLWGSQTGFSLRERGASMNFQARLRALRSSAAPPTQIDGRPTIFGYLKSDCRRRAVSLPLFRSCHIF